MNETNADPNDYNNAWDPVSQYNFYGITGQRLATVTCDGGNYPAYPTCAVTGQNVYFGRKLLTSNGVNVLTDRLGTVRANSQGVRLGPPWGGRILPVNGSAARRRRTERAWR